MKDEVSVAVRFISRLIERSNRDNNIDKEQLEVFKVRLGELLCERFKNHWFPEKPTRGQGYRCIRLNEIDQKEPVIDQAAIQCGLTYEQLRLPGELTIWVDPRDVCCRFGEYQGSFCALATFKSDGGEVIMEEINLDEIQKKNKEHKEKVTHEMGTRKNGRRGFLSGSGTNSSPNYKSRAYQNGMNNPHHGSGIHSPNPIAVNWYNSVNNQSSSPMDMFSSSPPNQYGYNLAKFSPPKYGYGTASKWNAPNGNLYGPTISSSKTDKYHWFNSTKPTIKA